MIYPSADKLNKIGSKYKLIAMASTRAKQLKAGMKPLIKTDSKNPLTIAFEEIAAGVITADIDEVDELALDFAEFTRISAYSENTELKSEDNGLDDIVKDNLNYVTSKTNKEDFNLNKFNEEESDEN